MRQTTFTIQGTFDQEAALLLRHRVMGDGARQATLDFSQVHTFEDTTLALLTVNLVLLRRKGCDITVRGLHDRQLRALSHFGVEVGTDGAVEIRLDREARFVD